MRFKPLIATIVLLVTSTVGSAQITKDKNQIMPLDEVTTGMTGIGKTVFYGTEPQEFKFVVVGIENKKGDHLIRVELSGGPNNILKETNVIAGMSGSPLYINNRLIGALREGWPSTKIPYALVQPIEDMLDFQPELLKQPNKYLLPVAEKISDKFKPKNGFQLKPGSSYSTCIIWGDIQKCSAATVTFVDEESGLFYTQGHSGGGLGITAIPVFQSRILKSVPRLDVSLKDYAPYGPMLGSIIFDGQYGQIGKIGVMPKSIPITIRLSGVLQAPITNTLFMSYTKAGIVEVLNSFVEILQANTDPSQKIVVETRLRVAGRPETYFSPDDEKEVGKVLYDLIDPILKTFDDPDSPDIEGIDINITAKVKEAILPKLNTPSTFVFSKPPLSLPPISLKKTETNKVVGYIPPYIWGLDPVFIQVLLLLSLLLRLETILPLAVMLVILLGALYKRYLTLKVILRKK